jgi:hypothetical protein
MQLHGKQNNKTGRVLSLYFFSFECVFDVKYNRSFFSYSYVFHFVLCKEQSVVLVAKTNTLRCLSPAIPLQLQLTLQQKSHPLIVDRDEHSQQNPVHIYAEIHTDSNTNPREFLLGNLITPVCAA